MRGMLFSLLLTRTYCWKDSGIAADLKRHGAQVMSLKPASNDFGCICKQIWKDQFRMKAYITINWTKLYCPKLCIKLIITMKNFFTFVMPLKWAANYPACRTTVIATRFRVAVICPIIQVPHCIRVFFYFVWFVFINHIFQFYNELCTYCNILDIYLS